MKSIYKVEFKYRTAFTIINWIFLFNISYIYKHILLFLYIKQVIYNEFINFYLISTNIIEILNLYIELTYIISNNIIFFYLIYDLITFLNNAFYKKEFNIIKLNLYLLFIINIGLNILIFIIIFPILWQFLKYFQETFTINLIYFEIKINEYYHILSYIYVRIKYCLVITLLSILILKKYINKIILIRTRKIYLFLLFIILIIIDNIITQFIVYFILHICYELIIFLYYFIPFFRIK